MGTPGVPERKCDEATSSGAISRKFRTLLRVYYWEYAGLFCGNTGLFWGVTRGSGTVVWRCYMPCCTFEARKPKVADLCVPWVMSVCVCVCVLWIIYVCARIHGMPEVADLCMPWVMSVCVCVCDMNHVRVCNYSWQAQSCRPMCAMSHECVCVCVCFESCTCVQLFMASQKSQTYVWQNSEHTQSRRAMCAMSHEYVCVCYESCTCVCH